MNEILLTLYRGLSGKYPKRRYYGQSCRSTIFNLGSANSSACFLNHQCDFQQELIELIGVSMRP